VLVVDALTTFRIFSNIQVGKVAEKTRVCRTGEVQPTVIWTEAERRREIAVVVIVGLVVTVVIVVVAVVIVVVVTYGCNIA